MSVTWNGRVAMQHPHPRRTVRAGTFLVVHETAPCAVRTLFNCVDFLPVRWSAMHIRFSVLSAAEQDIIYETFEVSDTVLRHACKCIEQVSKVHAARLPDYRRSVACLRHYTSVDLAMLHRHHELEGPIPTLHKNELQVYVDVQKCIQTDPALLCLFKGDIFRSPEN
jgi:hypothetical protein